MITREQALEAAQFISNSLGTSLSAELLLSDPWIAAEQQIFARFESYKSEKHSLNQDIWKAGDTLRRYFSQNGMLKKIASEGRDALIDIVPQTYGEAVKMYDGVILCDSHEWDNRTTQENARYLLGRIAAKFHLNRPERKTK